MIKSKNSKGEDFVKLSREKFQDIIKEGLDLLKEMRAENQNIQILLNGIEKNLVKIAEIATAMNNSVGLVQKIFQTLRSETEY